MTSPKELLCRMLHPSAPRMVIGYGAALGVILTLGISSASVQALQRAVPDFELASLRYAIQAVGLLLILSIMGKFQLHIGHQYQPWIIAIIFVNSGFNLTFYAASGLLPLVDVVGITITMSMVVVVVVRRVLMKHPVGLVQYVAIFISILSIFLMTQPAWIFGHVESPNRMTTNYSKPYETGGSPNLNSSCDTDIHRAALKNDTDGSLYLWGIVCTILSGIFVGSNHLLIHYCLSEVNVLIIGLWVGCSGSIACLISSIYSENITVSLPRQHWFLFVVHCVCASLNNVLTILSVSMIGSLKTSIICSLEVILFLVLQYEFMVAYAPGHRNWLEVTGAVVCCAGALLSPVTDLIIMAKNPNPAFNDFGTPSE